MFNLYRCKECNEVFAITPFDDNPGYQHLPEEGSYKEEPLENKNDSLSGHNGHHLEKLKPIKNTMVSEWDYCEPVKEIYFEATNGRERFVIKKWRENINEPMSYELIQGSLKIIIHSCEVREKELKKEWRRVMSKPLQEKGMVFLTVLKETVTAIKISKDPRMIFDTSNPLICYQRLNQQHIQMILKKLKGFITPLELKEVRTFIHDQNHIDGVIPLMIKKNFFIEKSDEKQAQSEKSEVCIPSRMKPIPDKTRPAEYQI